MALAGACGRWDSGFDGSIDPDRVVLAGVRELDSEERRLLESSEATVIGASTIETLVAVKNALDGAPVYVHLDVDVLDPEAISVQDPAPGGLSPDKLYDLFEAVVEDSELVGLEVTAFGDGDSAGIVMRVLEPLLQSLGDSVAAG
jgi:arginase/N-omega-hydroxy-L-arginine amidinohydrolase